jgi:hypothetical protein
MVGAAVVVTNGGGGGGSAVVTEGNAGVVGTTGPRAAATRSCGDNEWEQTPSLQVSGQKRWADFASVAS